jgi:hypothetical protein
MKTEQTIRRHIRELRQFIDNQENDALTIRVAYIVECVLLGEVEKGTVGWPTPLGHVLEQMDLVRKGI